MKRKNVILSSDDDISPAEEYCQSEQTDEDEEGFSDGLMEEEFLAPIETVKKPRPKRTILPVEDFQLEEEETPETLELFARVKDAVLWEFDQFKIPTDPEICPIKGKEIMKCVFSGCKKEYITYPSVNYHLAKFMHTPKDLFETKHEKTPQILARFDDLKARIAAAEKGLIVSVDVDVKCKGGRFKNAVHIMLSDPQPEERIKGNTLIIEEDDGTEIEIKASKRTGYKKPERVNRIAPSKIGDCSYCPTSTMPFIEGQMLLPNQEFIKADFSDYEILTTTEFNLLYDMPDSGFNFKLNPKDNSEPQTIPFLKSKKINSKGGVLMNVGIYVECLEWVDGNLDIDEQYLIIGGHDLLEPKVLGFRETAEAFLMKGIMQIWKFNGVQAELAMTITHEFGSIFDIKLCPKSFDKAKLTLGILAISFGDGSVRVINVPLPKDELQHCILNLTSGNEGIFI
jgi:hypothetical protein